MRRLLLLPIMICACSSSEIVIGAAGGTITIEGGPTLEFPAGALTEELAIAVEETELPHPIQLVYAQKSVAWKCEPTGTDFQQPVRVTMPYFPDDDPSSLVFLWSIDGGDFTPVMDAQIADGVATGTIRHFSVGFVGKPL